MSALEILRLKVDELDVDARRLLIALVAPAVARSAFKKPKTWPLAIALVRVDEKRVTSRADFAQWARANDLHDVAATCLRSPVRAGELLVWLDVDVPGVSAAGFVIVPLARLLAMGGRA